MAPTNKKPTTAKDIVSLPTCLQAPTSLFLCLDSPSVAKTTAPKAAKSTTTRAGKATKTISPKLEKSALTQLAEAKESVVSKTSASTKKVVKVKKDSVKKKGKAKVSTPDPIIDYTKVKGEYIAEEIKLIESDILRLRPTKPHPDDKKLLSKGWFYRKDGTLFKIFESLPSQDPPLNRKTAKTLDNAYQYKVRIEDMGLLVKLVIYGILSAGRGMCFSDFIAITEAYNRIIKYKLLKEGLEPKKYLLRGYNNLHSAMDKKKPKGCKDDLNMDLKELNAKYAPEETAAKLKAAKAKAEKKKTAKRAAAS
ncbi:hypothetical protein BKA61DRAFT_689356 [Leptodontidium sp. MPI-SDFR-AT-0119]|nr:hypothetical protein BKA61DRAFT_689356 [Leptodontidium sp. MPI-SDFR-AT-0119]